MCASMVLDSPWRCAGHVNLKPKCLQRYAIGRSKSPVPARLTFVLRSGIRVAKSNRQGTMGFKSANLCSKISEKLVNLLFSL